MSSNNSNKGVIMATYECPKCEMSVNATCGKCNEPLVNDMLKLDDGNEVQYLNVLTIMEKLSLHYVVVKI